MPIQILFSLTLSIIRLKIHDRVAINGDSWIIWKLPLTLLLLLLLHVISIVWHLHILYPKLLLLLSSIIRQHALGIKLLLLLFLSIIRQLLLLILKHLPLRLSWLAWKLRIRLILLLLKLVLLLILLIIIDHVHEDLVIGTGWK